METEAEFEPTLTLTGQERRWVLEALSGFYRDRILVDILYRVKGGKEATVFCCRGHPETSQALLAAKIFRPRMFRAMKNDAMYREGRALRDQEGKSLHESRQLRAMRKRTRFGKRLEEISWHQHEYAVLKLLYEAGADVPRPIAVSDNAILMEYVGDERWAAPALQDVTLERDEVEPMFHRLTRNIELFLACCHVHADLSAYNVLYWQGNFKIIDFPQAVDAANNHNAFFLLTRDIERICQYFQKYGIKAQGPQLAVDLWTRFMQAEL
jgi:RIO kinase 1